MLKKHDHELFGQIVAVFLREKGPELLLLNSVVIALGYQIEPLLESQVLEVFLVD